MLSECEIIIMNTSDTKCTRLSTVGCGKTHHHPYQLCVTYRSCLYYVGGSLMESINGNLIMTVYIHLLQNKVMTHVNWNWLLIKYFR